MKIYPAEPPNKNRIDFGIVGLGFDVSVVWFVLDILVFDLFSII